MITREVTHTQAPWAIEDYQDRPCRIRAEHNGMDVADVFCTDFPDGQANARLIAAAPELLEALRATLTLLGAIRNDGYAGEQLPMLDYILDGDETGESKAWQAIARAEGKV